MTIAKDNCYSKRELAADGTPIPSSGVQSLLCQHQHISVLKIRDALAELCNESIPIFLQDPAYSEEDEKVAAVYGMKIVNGNLGHQEGWLELDESTLVFDFRAETLLYQLAFEITRPAAFISMRDEYLNAMGQLHPKCKWFTAYSTTIRTNDNADVQVPGLGINEDRLMCRELGKEYTPHSFSSFLEEEGYKQTKEYLDFSEVYRDFHVMNLYVRNDKMVLDK